MGHPECDQVVLGIDQRSRMIISQVAGLEVRDKLRPALPLLIAILVGMHSPVYAAEDHALELRAPRVVRQAGTQDRHRQSVQSRFVEALA